jgi:hypothetical protein
VYLSPQPELHHFLPSSIRGLLDGTVISLSMQKIYITLSTLPSPPQKQWRKYRVAVEEKDGTKEETLRQGSKMERKVTFFFILHAFQHA